MTKDNLARQSHEAFQETGTIVGVSNGVFVVRSGAHEVQALRAASCMLEPEIGNEVVVVHHRRGSHVLAVLTRDADSPARLALDGGLEIAASVGAVSISARDGVHIATPADASVTAGAWRLSAGRGDVVVGALAYAGETVAAEVDRVKTIARTVESTATRWIQRLDRAYRFIANTEIVKADHLQFDARSAFHVKAESTVMTSESVTKIDGAQIHLG